MSCKELSQIHAGRQSKLVDPKINKDISSLKKEEFPSIFCCDLNSVIMKRIKEKNKTKKRRTNFLSLDEEKLSV